MPATISKIEGRQIIGGTFAEKENADKAIAAFQKMGIPDSNIQVVVQLAGNDMGYRGAMLARGFAESQAVFYEKAVREGKTLVAVHKVVEPAPVIEVFDKFKSEFNPNGTRNVRQDVFGMTAGAAIAATALGVAGAVVGGPVGAAAGIAAGTALGGGVGAAAGKAVEHNK